MKLTSEGHRSLVTLGVRRGAVYGICHAACAPEMAGACVLPTATRLGAGTRAGSRGRWCPRPSGSTAGHPGTRLAAPGLCGWRRVSAALDPLRDDRVPGASPAAGVLDVAGVTLCRRWCVTWGLWDPTLGQCGLFVVPARCPVFLHTPEH